jgi:hypothetical protein
MPTSPINVIIMWGFAAADHWTPSTKDQGGSR